MVREGQSYHDIAVMIEFSSCKLRRRGEKEKEGERQRKRRGEKEKGRTRRGEREGERK